MSTKTLDRIIRVASTKRGFRGFSQRARFAEVLFELADKVEKHHHRDMGFGLTKLSRAAEIRWHARRHLRIASCL